MVPAFLRNLKPAAAHQSRAAGEIIATSLAAIVLLVFCIRQLRAAWAFTTDDAYISLRYSAHWASGHGIVWNIGEAPVEGYSNFLYVALGALALKLGYDPVEVLKVTSSLALVGSLFLLYLLTAQVIGGVLRLVPVIGFLLLPGTYVWAVSGLETAAYVFAVLATVLASVWAVKLQNDQRDARVAAAVAGLGAFLTAVIRVEGPLIFGLAFLAFVGGSFIPGRDFKFQTRRVRELLLLAACFSVPYLSYLAWKLAYFGTIVPNTVGCKMGWGGSPWTLIIDFLLVAAVPALLSCMTPPARVTRLHFFFWGIPIVYCIALFGADPIIGHLHRHFLAAYAVLLPGAALGLYSLGQRLPRGRLLYQVLVPAATLVYLLSLDGKLSGFLKEHGRDYAVRMANRATAADWLAQNLPPGAAYAVGDAGMIPYGTPHLRVFDLFCLNNPEMSKPPYITDFSKYAPRVMQQRPEAIVMHSSTGDRLTPRDEYGVFPAIAAHEDFRTHYRLTTRFSAADNFHYFIYLRKP